VTWPRLSPQSTPFSIFILSVARTFAKKTKALGGQRSLNVVSEAAVLVAELSHRTSTTADSVRFHLSWLDMFMVDEKCRGLLSRGGAVFVHAL
jgi:hypothetical protein